MTRWTPRSHLVLGVSIGVVSHSCDHINIAPRIVSNRLSTIPNSSSSINRPLRTEGTVPSSSSLFRESVSSCLRLSTDTRSCGCRHSDPPYNCPVPDPDDIRCDDRKIRNFYSPVRVNILNSGLNFSFPLTLTSVLYIYFQEYLLTKTFVLLFLQYDSFYSYEIHNKIHSC